MSKIGGDMGVKKFISHPSLKIYETDFRNFLGVSQKWHCLKILKVWRKLVSRKLVKFRVLYIGRMPGICWGANPRDGVNTITLRLRYSFTLGVVGVERSMSKSARRTSQGWKIGAWCICDAPKARPAVPSPHLGCVFVQRRRKRQMARTEGPSRCFGYCSFEDERRSSGGARRAEPPRPFLVASDQKRQILALVVSP